MRLLIVLAVLAGYCDLNGSRIEGAITPKQCRSLYKDQVNGVRVYGVWRRS